MTNRSFSQRTLYRPGLNYYKIGVGLLELSNDRHQQFDMFATNDPGNPALMNALDNLNSRFGSNTLFIAAQGIDEKWEMKREYLSSQYTTDWRHIPVVHCD